MKKLKLGFVVVMLALVFGVADSTLAQNIPMVGGYKTVSVTDQGVINAANFATNKINEIEKMEFKYNSVLKAEQQLVQGMNYSLFFKVTYAAEGKVGEGCLTATVYRSLKNVYALSKWAAVDCPVAAPIMVGGFKAVSVTDKNIISAANFALNKIGEAEEMDLKMGSILKAEQQVVQGMNYKILFKSISIEDGEEYELCLSAKVYRSLKNIYTLSNYEPLECPE